MDQLLDAFATYEEADENRPRYAQAVVNAGLQGHRGVYVRSYRVPGEGRFAWAYGIFLGWHDQPSQTQFDRAREACKRPRKVFPVETRRVPEIQSEAFERLVAELSEHMPRNRAIATAIKRLSYPALSPGSVPGRQASGPRRLARR